MLESVHLSPCTAVHFPNWAHHPTSAQGLAARSKAAQISTQSLREQHAAICMEEPLGISLGEWHRGCCRHSSGAVNATTQHAVWIRGWSLLTSKVAHKRICVSFYRCLHLSKWCVLFFCCCFMCSSCTLALLLCSPTETPGGAGKYSSICVHVWKYVCVCVVQDPQHFLSYSLSLTHTLIQTQLFSSGQYFLLSKTIHQLGAFFLESQNQIFPVNIFAIIWTCCTRGPN